jgi:hypothetical protein
MQTTIFAFSVDRRLLPMVGQRVFIAYPDTRVGLTQEEKC